MWHRSARERCGLPLAPGISLMIDWGFGYWYSDFARWIRGGAQLIGSMASHFARSCEKATFGFFLADRSLRVFPRCSAILRAGSPLFAGAVLPVFSYPFVAAVRAVGPYLVGPRLSLTM